MNAQAYDRWFESAWGGYAFAVELARRVQIRVHRT